jgi:hypothetical protein
LVIDIQLELNFDNSNFLKSSDARFAGYWVLIMDFNLGKEALLSSPFIIEKQELFLFQFYSPDGVWKGFARRIDEWTENKSFGLSSN